MAKLDSNWQEANDNILYLQNQLIGCSGNDSIVILQTIDRLIAEKGLAIGMALRQLNSEIAANVRTTWVSRLNHEYVDAHNIIKYWSYEQYDSIFSLLNNTVEKYPEAENDKTNFLILLDTMNQILLNGGSFYSLNESQLSNLITLSSMTFGKYTDIVRGFLSIFYDVHLYESINVNPRSSKYLSPINLSSSIPIIIVPNPTKNGCFQLKSNGIEDRIVPMYLVCIFDIYGRKVYFEEHSMNSKICLPGPLNSGVYYISLTNKITNEEETYKLLFEHE